MAPDFSDDMDTSSLLSAIQGQIEFLKKHNSNIEVFPAEKTPSADELRKSLRNFANMIRQNPNPVTLHDFITENYDIYQAGGRKNRRGREMLVTGYYEPVFKGSLTRNEPYLYPIYSPPDDLIMETDDNGKPRTGRLVDNVFHSYWSRGEIEKHGLLKGYELAWLRDPFDAFLLHVQGSGRIRLPDNSLKTVRFASSNGLEYDSIGKLLVDEKEIPLEEVTVPAIRSYLNNHPKDLQRILHHNRRFIFFTWGDSRPPRGSSGVVLTPGRSIAIDNSVLPNGVIGYLSTTKPEVNQQGEITGWTPLKRFVLPQDSGAA
ncbi:MAG: MltA domain-containing protein, partial [Deltaproteobacteria bacterium]|nr:MltA domain-containing protein [Deltaproteobacteria bacterium]